MRKWLAVTLLLGVACAVEFTICSVAVSIAPSLRLGLDTFFL
jgi:hypothetical protein